MRHKPTDCGSTTPRPRTDRVTPDCLSDQLPPDDGRRGLDYMIYPLNTGRTRCPWYAALA